MVETFQDLEKRVARNLARKKNKTIHKMPDKTRIVGEIIDYFFYQQSDLKETVFYANRIRFPKDKHRPERYEIRLGYWVISTKPNSKTFGTWVWGQFCPLLPSADMQAIYKKMAKLGWIENKQK